MAYKDSLNKPIWKYTQYLFDWQKKPRSVFEYEKQNKENPVWQQR